MNECRERSRRVPSIGWATRSSCHLGGTQASFITALSITCGVAGRWLAVASSSRPGALSFLNLFNLQRQQARPRSNGLVVAAQQRQRALGTAGGWQLFPLAKLFLCGTMDADSPLARLRGAGDILETLYEIVWGTQVVKSVSSPLPASPPLHSSSLHVLPLLLVPPPLTSCYINRGTLIFCCWFAAGQLEEPVEQCVQSG